MEYDSTGKPYGFFPAGHPASLGPMLTIEQQMLAALERICVLLTAQNTILEALRDRAKPAQTAPAQAEKTKRK